MSASLIRPKDEIIVGSVREAGGQRWVCTTIIPRLYCRTAADGKLIWEKTQSELFVPAN